MAEVPLRPLIYRWRAMSGNHDVRCHASNSYMPSSCDAHDWRLSVLRQRPRQHDPTLIPLEKVLAPVNSEPLRVLVSLRICENLGPVVYTFPMPRVARASGRVRDPVAARTLSGLNTSAPATATKPVSTTAAAAAAAAATGPETEATHEHFGGLAMNIGCVEVPQCV
jgi:hypothetical protein